MPKLGVTKHGVSLRSILPQATFLNADDFLIRSCCGRGEECLPGDLFVALIDEDSDGHSQVDTAIANGATAIVAERWVVADCPVFLVKDSRQAYAEICQALAGQPTEHLAAVGIAGSFGKTCIARLLDNVLSSVGHRVASYDSISATIAGRDLPLSSHVWTAPQLSYLLARFAIEDCSHAIVELPSRCLAHHQAKGIGLDVAILANIRQHQLELHGNIDNYRRVLKRSVELLKPNGVAVVNADDPLCHALLEELTCPTLTYGVHQDANVQGRMLESVWGEQTILISAGDDSVVVSTSQVGKAALEHCLATATAALALGLSLSEIARGLEQCHVIPGRMQTIQCGQGFGVLIDSARHPETLGSLLSIHRDHPTGRTLCLCTCSPDQTHDQRYHISKAVEKASDLVVFTGVDAAAQPIDYEPFHQMLDGMREPGRAQIVPDRIRAIEWLLSQAKPGDRLFITGMGEQPIALLDEEQFQINDLDVCRAWLYESAESERADSNGAWGEQEMTSVDEHPWSEGPWRSESPESEESNPAAQIFNIDDYRDHWGGSDYRDATTVGDRFADVSLAGGDLESLGTWDDLADIDLLRLWDEADDPCASDLKEWNPDDELGG